MERNLESTPTFSRRYLPPLNKACPQFGRQQMFKEISSVNFPSFYRRQISSLGHLAPQIEQLIRFFFHDSFLQNSRKTPKVPLLKMLQEHEHLLVKMPNFLHSKVEISLCRERDKSLIFEISP